MKKLLLVFLLIFLPTPAAAQLGSVPYTFTPGTTIYSAEVNSNFSQAYANALNRTGGTMTGSLTTLGLLPTSDNASDIGSAALSYNDAWFDGTVTIATAAITTATIPTLTAPLTISGGEVLISTGIADQGAFLFQSLINGTGFAGLFKNTHANGNGLTVQAGSTGSESALLVNDNASAQLMKIDGLGRAFFANKIFSNDTVNSNMSYGLTINQGTADDEVLALRSTDVAHGITTWADTASFLVVTKNSAASGGALLRGLSEGLNALVFVGEATGVDTAKTVGASAAITLQSNMKTGTTHTTPSADANLLTLGDTLAGNKFIFDVEGDLWSLGSMAVGGIGGTANSFMTIGVTVYQGANDDEAFDLKSSDVAHGATAIQGTDSYLMMKKLSPTDGGATLSSGSEATLSMLLRGMAVTEDTTKSTAGLANLYLNAHLISGGVNASHGANGNLLVVANNSSAKFIVDAEGDIHYDGTDAGAYDGWDDIHLLRALDTGRSGFKRTKLDDTLLYDKADLVKAGIITPSGFISLTQHTQLLNGAMWQLHQRITELELQIAGLQGK